MKILLGDIMYERNLTARQVEIMTGVSKSTVSRIANNQIVPRLDTLEELAKGLCIKISDLYVPSVDASFTKISSIFSNRFPYIKQMRIIVRFVLEFL